jgi:hypothetical protein
MTTSLGNSTIPAFDPNDTYTSPRPAPRVKYEGYSNMEKDRLHTKSIIPGYNPNDTYTSPRPVPRIKTEGYSNYEKNRGSLNIGDWSIQGRNWESPRPVPKIKYEVAEQSYIKNRGTFKLILKRYLTQFFNLENLLI